MTDIYNPLDKINLGNSVATALLEQPVHPLGDIPSFEGAGIYVLYYRGPLSPLTLPSRRPTPRKRAGLFI